jgi:methionyl-tRNA formyltransferase
MLKMALLSAPDAPFTGRAVEALKTHGVTPEAIILDSKAFSEKDKQIHHQRTEGRLPPVPVDPAVPLFRVASHNDDDAADLVRDMGIDFLVNAETPRILKPAMLSATRIGVINCHPGWLPDFRGSSCVEWALYEEKPVANTIHVMTDGIDEGPIVERETVPVEAGDSYVDVRVRVFERGIALLARTAAELCTGVRTPDMFLEQGEGRYFRPIDPDKLATVIARLEASRPARSDK